MMGMSERKEHTSVTLRPDQKEYIGKTDKNISGLLRDLIDQRMKEEGFEPEK